MSKVDELKETRAALVDEQRKIVDLADKEKRNFSSEEEERYQKIDVDFESLTNQIADVKKQEDERAARLESLELREEELKKAVKPVSDRIANDPQGKDERSDNEYADCFRRALAHGVSALSRDERRALSAGTDTEGGFMVVPQAFSASFVQAINDMVFIRPRATVISVPNAASLGVPTLAADPADAEWTSEIVSSPLDTAMAFGKRSLTPSPVKKSIKVSEKLVRVAAHNIDSIVRDRLAYKFAITHEKAFLNGTGESGVPLGLFTASANGISTSRDIATDNAATKITPDGLINAKYALKAQYQARAEWVFHRDVIKNIRKMKDGAGDYLWKQGLMDQADTILDVPYNMSEYAPNTLTAGLYAGLIGDLSFYWIADALNMTIKVADQIYIETGQIGYFGQMESDGMPVLEEAFARVTMGS